MKIGAPCRSCGNCERDDDGRCAPCARQSALAAAARTHKAALEAYDAAHEACKAAARAYVAELDAYSAELEAELDHLTPEGAVSSTSPAASRLVH